MRDIEMGRRERRNLERRAHLLTVARRLFDAKGVEATTVAEIAQTAELSTRTVYNFFPTKVDLLAAVLSAEIQARLSSWRGRHTNPRNGVLALIRSQLETLGAASKAEQRLVAAHAILAGSDSEAGRYSAEVDAFIRLSIRDLIAKYVSDGALPSDLDPEVASSVINAMLNGLYLDWLQGDRELDAGLPVIAAALDLILRR